MSEFLGIFDDEVSAEYGFHVDDDQKAEWAIRKIKEQEAERDRQIEVCEKQKTFYEECIESEKKRFENNTAYLRMELIEYFQKVPHKETKTQESYKLPSGTLKMTKAKLDFEHDDEKLLAYLKQNEPELVAISEKPMWGELKKRLIIVGDNAVDSETGAVIDGVTVVEKPESFDIK